MEPKFEPKQHTPEEIAWIEKSRASSDAELLKGGAEYVVDENGEKVLRVTEAQVTKEKLYNTPIEEIIQLYPELAERMEAIRMSDGEKPMSLLRMKNTPERATAIFSRPNDYTDGERIYIRISETNLPQIPEMAEGKRAIMFNTVAACCLSEIGNAQSENKTGDPRPEYSKMYPGRDYDEDRKEADSQRGGIGATAEMIRMQHFMEADQHWLKRYDEAWREWIKPKRKEFFDALQSLCEKNGIKEVVMTHYHGGEFDEYLDKVKIVPR